MTSRRDCSRWRRRCGVQVLCLAAHDDLTRGQELDGTHFREAAESLPQLRLGEGRGVAESLGIDRLLPGVDHTADPLDLRGIDPTTAGKEPPNAEVRRAVEQAGQGPLPIAPRPPDLLIAG